MDSLQRATVSFGIFDDDLDPFEITAMLGSEPEVGVRKGDSFVGYDGKPRFAKTGRWTLTTGYESPPDINRQITSLLSRLTGELSVWKEIKTRFDSHVSVGGYFTDWTGGFFLESATVALLAERGLGIDFDLYAPAASDR